MPGPVGAVGAAGQIAGRRKARTVDTILVTVEGRK